MTTQLNPEVIRGLVDPIASLTLRARFIPASIDDDSKGTYVVGYYEGGYWNTVVKLQAFEGDRFDKPLAHLFAAAPAIAKYALELSAEVERLRRMYEPTAEEEMNHYHAMEQK